MIFRKRFLKTYTYKKCDLLFNDLDARCINEDKKMLCSGCEIYHNYLTLKRLAEKGRINKND